MHDETLIQDLTNKLGFFIKTVTNRKLVLVGESVIPKQTDDYVMVEQSVIADPNWHSNEELDANGFVRQSWNSQVNFIITVCKGDTLNDAAKIKHSLHLPWINHEYFKDPRFAFASCTNAQKQRVPIDYQTFEDRARFVVVFNVLFVGGDYGAFEDLEKFRILFNVQDPPLDNTAKSGIELYNFVDFELPITGDSTWINVWD